MDAGIGRAGCGSRRLKIDGNRRHPGSPSESGPMDDSGPIDAAVPVMGRAGCGWTRIFVGRELFTPSDGFQWIQTP
jgi:hypothetical protein